MIEEIRDIYYLKQQRAALKVNRYKKQGYIVVGIGYPFFYNEYLGLIKLCDFFADDASVSDINGWNRRFVVKDYKDIEPNKKYVVLLFSSNRIFVLEKIKQILSDVEIINLYEDSEIIKSLSDIEKSTMFLYKATKNKFIDIKNAISVMGNCLIVDTAKTTLEIISMEMQTGSRFINSSRFKNIFDSLWLSKDATFQLSLDGQADIRNCLLNDNSKINVYSGNLKIEDAYIGENCTIHVYNQISIGSGTIISWNVNIMDGDGHSIYYDDKDNSPKPIVIEENVWIGHNAVILKGLTIGKGSVVAADSVVTKSIPPYSLVAGNPARIVKNNIKWDYKYNFMDF